MKKLFFTVITLCCVCFIVNYSGAESERTVVGTYDIGGINLSINAKVYDNEILEARTYVTKPAEYVPEKLISYFWNASDMEAVLDSKEVIDQHVERDGFHIYSEYYSYAGATLSVGFHSGRMSYRAKALEEWGYKDVCDETISECISPLDADLLNAIASVWGKSIQLVPVYTYSVQETKTTGATFSYNVYDYAVIMDGIYCENQSYLTALSEEDMSIPAQYVQIWTNDDGLLMMTASLYDVSSDESYADIMTYQEAIDCLCEELSWYIADDTVEIRSIVLEYIMTPVRGSTLSFQYVPAWKFQTQEQSWMPYNEMEGSCYRFNAVTGELIE